MDTHAFKLKQKLTGKAKLQEETKRAIKIHMEEVCKDRLLLLSIVTGGKEHYRGIAGKAFRSFLVDDGIISGMFDFFVERAGENPKQQFEELQRSELVALKLDKLQGLCRFIESEAHLEEVLDRCVPEGSERQAIRSQMLVILKAQQTRH